MTSEITDQPAPSSDSIPWWGFSVLFLCFTGLLACTTRSFDVPYLFKVLYTPFGVCENFQALLYGACCVVGGKNIWDAWKAKNRFLLIFTSIVFAWAFFMLGEETRWGLVYFVDEGTSMFSFQDLLMDSLLEPMPEKPVMDDILGMVITRLVAALGAIYGVIAVWHFRARIQPFIKAAQRSPYTLYFVFYVFYFLAAVYIEVVLNAGRIKFNDIEETFEANAALVWFLLVYRHSEDLKISS